MKKIILSLLIANSFLIIFHLGAQTPVIKWSFNTRDASFGQSAAGDIDNDGKLEVVFGCYRNDSTIYALNAEDGTLLWKYNTGSSGAEGCNDVAPIIVDVDNDGSLEVIVPSSCNPVTYCFNGQTGAVKWKCNTRGSDSPPTFADLNNDGKPEILHGEFGGYVICINAQNGLKMWEIAVNTNSWVQTAPTIVDLDNNGQLDFVVGTWNFDHLDSIYAFRGDNQSRLWTYPVHNYMYHGTAVSDLDKDGKPELLVGSYNDTLYCLNGENGTLDWIYVADGGYIGSPVSIGDIDHDGNCDVLFVSGYKVIALTNKGKYKWHYEIPDYSGAFRGVVLADINNDIFTDVVFGTGSGKVIALTGNNGSQLWSMDLAAHYGDSKFALDHAPLIADFDKDDTLDLFIVGGHAEYPDFYKDFGRAYMLSVGKGKGPDWLMFQHDIRRQSSLCSYHASHIEVLNNTNKTPVTIFPNPSNNSATLYFNNSRNENYTLRIYNTQGQLMEKIENIMGNEVNITHDNLKSGIFFFQLQCESGYSETGKFMVIK